MWLFLLILLLHVVMLLTTTTVDNTPISHKYYWYCFYYTWQNKLLQWFYLIVKDMILTREPDTVYLQYSVNLSSEVLTGRSEVRGQTSWHVDQRCSQTGSEGWAPLPVCTSSWIYTQQHKNCEYHQTNSQLTPPDHQGAAEYNNTTLNKYLDN